MKLIILTRDGVINHGSDELIKSVDEWHPIDGSLQAMGRLYQAGYTLVIATNQSGIAKGLYDIQTLHAIHAKMGRMLEQYGGQVDSVFFCPHAPEEDCDCRKPRDGLFRDIMTRYQCSLKNVPAIGDCLRDIQAARSAGAQPVLVKTGKGENTLEKAKKKDLKGVPVYQDLAEVADAILAESDS
jgi:D-glycero-D-manno-heptose 1,7-bisphosphate phosphatase